MIKHPPSTEAAEGAMFQTEAPTRFDDVVQTSPEQSVPPLDWL